MGMSTGKRPLLAPIPIALSPSRIAEGTPHLHPPELWPECKAMGPLDARREGLPRTAKRR